MQTKQYNRTGRKDFQQENKNNKKMRRVKGNFNRSQTNRNVKKLFKNDCKVTFSRTYAANALVSVPALVAASAKFLGSSDASRTA